MTTPGTSMPGARARAALRGRAAGARPHPGMARRPSPHLPVDRAFSDTAGPTPSCRHLAESHCRRAAIVTDDSYSPSRPAELNLDGRQTSWNYATTRPKRWP